LWFDKRILLSNQTQEVIPMVAVTVIRKHYETDLSDIEWLLLEPLVPPALKGGRERTVVMREVVNAIFYWLRAGCAWSLLPHDFPPASTVYGYFNQWRKRGTWPAMNDTLRAAVREQEEREAEATAGSIDSQSVKTTNSAPEDRGFDGGKQINGRKRFILVDVMGLLLKAIVTKASVPERKGAQTLLTNTPSEILKHLALLWVDGGYDGPAFADWVLEHYDIFIEVIKRSDGTTGFVLLPLRWVVERTFSWFGKFRRLSKDYERLLETSAAVLYAAMIRIMLSRLAHEPTVFC
jgi:putative transposase